MSSYVSPWMSSDLEVYRDTLRRFVETEIVPHQDRFAKQQHVDRELWTKAGELGVLCADIPEEYGGAGGNFAHMAALFDELAAAGDTSFGVHVHIIVAHYLLNHGTEEQKRKYLPQLASGAMVSAIAMSEPAAGSDLQGVRTRAVRDGDGYVINGSKTFISNGYLADLIVVVAKTDAQPVHAAFRCCWSRRARCRAFASVASSTRSDRRGRTPANCSSTTCACRPMRCLAAPKARALRS